MKPQNVIICGGKGKVDIAKIIDFGNTRSATLQKKPERFKGFPGLMEDWTRFGTPGYIGPESWAWGSQNIKSEAQLAKKDSFAVGMTIINGLLAPFLNMAELKAKPREPKAKVLNRIQTWKKTFRDKTVEQKLRQNGLLDLAEAAVGLIEENPQTRLTVEEALRRVTQNAEIVKKNGMIEIMKI
jgi:serine/threonine protein kinase